MSDTIAAATMAAAPVVIMNGITGTSAPSPVEIPAAAAACTASPPLASVTPNSSADRACNIASG